MVTYRLLYSTYHQMLPTLTLPREDFPRGDRYFKHVPPLRYLIYLSVFLLPSSIYTSRHLFEARVQLSPAGFELTFFEVPYVSSRLP